MSLAIPCRGPRQTEAVGEALGRAARAGLVVALQGPLGAGKTVLTKGIARGLGVPDPKYVCSPTFTIHKVYRGRLTLHHLDFYRLETAADLEDLGIEEALSGSGVCVIEWPDLFFSEIPPDRITVQVETGPGDERVLHFEARGDLASAVYTRFEEALRETGGRNCSCTTSPS